MVSTDYHPQEFVWHICLCSDENGFFDAYILEHAPTTRRLPPILARDLRELPRNKRRTWREDAIERLSE
ncbi:MAG: hypothetical protein H8F28_24280, partial [Fibrella sp.]|nr:hypothetical protein [Armatimonadota bacterium]